MLNLEFVGLVIKDKNSNIIAIAREIYDGTLVFRTLKENENPEKIALYKTEKEAKKSFTAKASKGSYSLSDEVAMIVEDNFGFVPFKAWYGNRLNSYEEIKSIVETINLNVNYTEV